MTDKTKQRIQELVPEVMNYDCGRHREIDLECQDCVWNDCSLAVVLQALTKNKSNFKFYQSIDKEEHWCLSDFRTYARWNLTKDYDGQSEEFKRFLGKLLGVS